MNLGGKESGSPWYRDAVKLAFLGFLGIAGYFLITEHWAHVVPWLPYALLLACPLLHIFMHRGHGGHGGHAGHGSRGEEAARKPQGLFRAPPDSRAPDTDEPGKRPAGGCHAGHEGHGPGRAPGDDGGGRRP